MNPLFLNLVLALLWAAVTGDFGARNLGVGLLLGLVVLLVAERIVGRVHYLRKIGLTIGFAAFFTWELFQANLRVAHDILTPHPRMRPGIVALPLDDLTDVEATLLANLITLTPGTLSLDVSNDRRVLYFHSMYIDDVETLRRQVKDGFERRVKEVMR